MLRVNYLGTKHYAQDPDPAAVEALLDVLRREPLDPTFERYGNFVMEAPGEPGVVRVWGNFFHLSHVFSVDTDDTHTINRLVSAIRSNQATDAYKVAQREVAAHEAAKVTAAQRRRAAQLATARRRR